MHATVALHLGGRGKGHKQWVLAWPGAGEATSGSWGNWTGGSRHLGFSLGSTQNSAAGHCAVRFESTCWLSQQRLLWLFSSGQSSLSHILNKNHSNVSQALKTDAAMAEVSFLVPWSFPACPVHPTPVRSSSLRPVDPQYFALQSLRSELVTSRTRFLRQPAVPYHYPKATFPA